MNVLNLGIPEVALRDVGKPHPSSHILKSINNIFFRHLRCHLDHAALKCNIIGIAPLRTRRQ